MRTLLILSVIFSGLGCTKTIHEARGPGKPGTLPTDFTSGLGFTAKVCDFRIEARQLKSTALG